MYYVDDAPPDRLEEYRDYYACHRPGGTPFRIAHLDTTIYSSSSDTSYDIDGFAFSGRFVGFGVVGCGIFGCSTDFSVFDVRRRRKVRSASSPTGSAVTVVVSPTGRAAALVAYNNSSHDPPDGSVLVIGRGKTTELDRGPDLRDLTIDGSVLHWLNGSEQRSATLG